MGIIEKLVKRNNVYAHDDYNIVKKSLSKQHSLFQI